MAENPIDQKNNNKVNLITTVLRLGHEAFQKNDLLSSAYHILNNTRVLIKYDRACLVDMRQARPKMIAVSGQSEVKQTSEYSLNMRKLLEPLKAVTDQCEITKELLQENKASESSLKAFEYFNKQNIYIILIPLVKVGSVKANECSVFWVVEFFGEFDKSSFSILSLISQHYREAIWYYTKENDRILPRLMKNRKIFTPLKVLIYLIILFVIISFFRISQNVAGTFELTPSDESTVYAPYSGIISGTDYKNGAAVQTGNIILKYDTEEMKYNLLDAENTYNEISAELDWVKQNSFVDKKELGKVKILVLKRKREEIEIEKIKWYLSKADIKAKINGTLVLNDMEKWTGKAVRAGEKLFEVVSPHKLFAEVMLNEADAAVLNSKTHIVLYLHSRPETPITGKIISASPKPMLTKTGQFCYIITMKLSDVDSGYIVGMRGIARISGDKVSIGYYLFKNIVLWWRKL